MKKIVGLLAMLALVFVLAGCPDPVNPPASVPEAGTSDPVKPSVPAGETYEIVLDGTYTANVNTYGSDPKGETQVKIPTNISGLKVGDKVVLKMKGTASYEVPFIEICLADTSEAAGWWMMLDEAKYEDEAVTEFDIEHTFTVTTAPKTGAEIVINGKGSRDTLTLDCTPKADDGEGDDNEGESGVEDVTPPAGDEGDDNGEPKETVLLEGLALSWSGTDTIGDNMADIKVGDKVYFTLTATGTQECQFIKKGWAGGLGTDVISIYDAETDAVVTYYAGGENAGDPKDRPAVSLDGTKTFYFIVTDAFMELKDVATVVGTATVVKMWY